MPAIRSAAPSIERDTKMPKMLPFYKVIEVTVEDRHIEHAQRHRANESPFSGRAGENPAECAISEVLGPDEVVSVLYMTTRIGCDYFRNSAGLTAFLEDYYDGKEVGPNTFTMRRV